MAQRNLLLGEWLLITEPTPWLLIGLSLWSWRQILTRGPQTGFRRKQSECSQIQEICWWEKLSNKSNFESWEVLSISQILLSPLAFCLPSCINTYLIILRPNSSAAKPYTPSLSSLLSSGFIIRILSSEVYSEMPINKSWPCPVKLVLWIRS